MTARGNQQRTQANLQRKRVLFVCIGNSCRSPMAEALARHLASDVIESSSAGLSPLGRVAEPMRKVLRERGIAVDGLRSKGLNEVEPGLVDLVINMTGMPGRAVIPAGQVVDWDVTDPYGEELGIYREVCDDVEERVLALAEAIRKEQVQTSAAGDRAARTQRNG